MIASKYEPVLSAVEGYAGEDDGREKYERDQINRRVCNKTGP